MAFPLFDLSGGRILVTGLSQGIGFASARGLAEHGASGVLSGGDETRLAQSAEVLKDEGHEVTVAVFDVTDSDAVIAHINPTAANVDFARN